MSEYSHQEEFYNRDSNTPSLIDGESPQFCKRISAEELDANTKTNTHKELLKMGSLMNTPRILPPDIFKIKTMSLEELDDYVEKKLSSKDNYSSEVIYLLFKIQTLLLEKEQMNSRLSDNAISITKLQKELLCEKTLTMDLKDNMKESVCEIESNEKEYKIELNSINEKYRLLSISYDNNLSRKNLYEKYLFYIVPITLILLMKFISTSIDTLIYLAYKIVSYI